MYKKLQNLAKVSKISKEKGVELIADWLFVGRKRKEIVQEMLKAYNVCESLTDRWIKAAKVIVGERRKEVSLDKARLIKETTEETVKRLNLGLETILLEYKKIAFSDITDFVNVVEREIPLEGQDNKTQTVRVVEMNTTSGLPADKKGAISEIRQTEAGVSLKIHDKKGALDSICRILGYAAPTKIASTDKDGNDKEAPLTDEQVDKILEKLDIK